ncbi:hypothetical protein RHMOL_Rhmol13G0139600 [Rhododendron molle]|uniref:Uncharacterized protein n=1 Tax=Rhododendron molle TaxID=49168 RepID=A0ACC0L7F8_RHOML|nr:hypothetical protein RHMOL_Rhmol13G0139600 [Rhododendron molle]
MQSYVYAIMNDVIRHIAQAYLEPKSMYIRGGFGFRLFVRLEYTKLFDGLPETLDMESTIVIKVARILLFIFFFYHMFTHFYQLMSAYEEYEKKLREVYIAIVRATNHVERPVKQKHLRGECSLKMEMACSFDSCPFCTSATRPRAGVANRIHALARRLSSTYNWAVALKTLIIIHHALRELDPLSRRANPLWKKKNPYVHNMAHFKDDSNPNGMFLLFYI